jgi:lauroyl/myristoyl acyltransferase
MMLIDVLPTLVNPKYTTEVTFFGRRAWFPNGIASLFFATGPRLFHWRIHRNQKTGYQEIKISEVTDSFRPAAGKAEFMQTLVGLLEQGIRRYPDHWLAWSSLGDFYRKPER